MSNVTQTIPSYIAGISQQPDEFKVPGQVNVATNVFPDITEGLSKRPGTRFIKQLDSAGAGTDSQDLGKWFHYYRNETEQYLGQISRAGDINMWKCSDGSPVDVISGANSSAMATYLTHTADQDIQTLTLNDYTYITNRTETTRMSSTKEADRPPEAFIELKKVAYANQYAVNLFDNTNLTTVKTATRISVKREITSEGCCKNAETIGSYPTSGVEPGSLGWREFCDADAGSRRDSLCPNVDTQIFNINYGAAGDPANANTLHRDWTWTYSGSGGTDRKDLYIRLTTTGQAVAIDGGTGDVYRCRYTTNWDLLHGGIGWQTGDYVDLWMKGAKYRVTIESHSESKVQANLGLIRPEPTSFDTKTTVTAESILGSIRTGILGSNNSGTNTLYQWDDDSADEGTNNYNGYQVKQIGNGLYITRPTDQGSFNISSPVGDLLNVLTDAVEDVADLPRQCKHGYVVKISNSEADEDDYYVKFIGNNDRDGEGVWEECAKPGTEIEFDKGTMPLALIRTADGKFRLTQLDGSLYEMLGTTGGYSRSGTTVTVSNTSNPHGLSVGDLFRFDATSGGAADGDYTVLTVPSANSLTFTHLDSGTISSSTCSVAKLFSTPKWDNAQVGDTSVDGTNPQPSFIGKTINKMLFFRNRLVMLSDENVIMSRPGDFYNFWAKSAITFTATDPIDISCSSEYPAIVYDGIQVNSGLVLFTKNQQFMLTTDSDVLSPLTAKINFISAYNFNHNTNPFSLGTTIGFIDNVGQHSRFMEMARVLREGEPDVIEQSKVVSELLDKNLNIVSASKENGLAAFSEKDKKTLYCYKFFNTSDKRLHQAWFTWEFQWQIQYHFIIDDSLYLVLNTESSDEVDNNGKCMLIKLDLKLHSDTLQTYTGTSTDKENIHSVYLDCATEVSIASNTYNASTNKTTFPLPTDWWTTEAAGGDMAIYDNSGTDPVGRYAEVTINGSNVEVVGDWSSTTVVLGILYEMEVEFPKIYPTSQQGESVRSDTRGSLVLHRNKINLGASGLYQTVLKRRGKTTFTEDHESVIADYSEESELPTQQLQTKVIPIYDRNTNTTLTLKSKHPTPLTLFSMTWEGDYTNKFYSSV